MAADCEAEHWHWKSSWLQPALEAADEIQSVAQVGTAAALDKQAPWAETWAARPRRVATRAYFMVAVVSLLDFVIDAKGDV